MSLQKRDSILQRQTCNISRPVLSRASQDKNITDKTTDKLSSTRGIVPSPKMRPFNRSASAHAVGSPSNARSSNTARQKTLSLIKGEQVLGYKRYGKTSDSSRANINKLIPDPYTELHRTFYKLVPPKSGAPHWAAVAYERLRARTGNVVTGEPQTRVMKPEVCRSSTAVTGSISSCVDLGAAGDSTVTMRDGGSKYDAFQIDRRDEGDDYKKETMPPVATYDRPKMGRLVKREYLTSLSGTDEGVGDQSKPRMAEARTKNFCLDAGAGGDRVINVKEMPTESEYDFKITAADDEEDDEDESGAPQAFRSFNHYNATLPTSHEITRERQSAFMEEITREVEPEQMLDHLRQCGFFNYNYSQHARTTTAYPSMKSGKNKVKEKLLLQIGIVG